MNRGILTGILQKIGYAVLEADNAKKVVHAGADVLVMGTEIFHSNDYKAKIREIRKKIG